MKKRTIKQELFYLFSMELLSGILFWVVYIMWVMMETEYGTAAIFYPLLVLTLILVQGSLYWLNCLRRIQKKRALNTKQIARIYQRLKIVDYALLAIYIPVLFITKSDGRMVTIIGCLIWLFAIIELINYFHYRLSYYTKSGLGLQVVKPAKLLFSGKAAKSQIAKEIFASNKNN